MSNTMIAGQPFLASAGQVGTGLPSRAVGPFPPQQAGQDSLPACGSKDYSFFVPLPTPGTQFHIDDYLVRYTVDRWVCIHTKRESEKGQSQR